MMQFVECGQNLKVAPNTMAVAYRQSNQQLPSLAVAS